MMARSGRSFKGNTEMAEDGGENAGVSELVKLLLEDRRMREEATAREAELMEERRQREVEHQRQVEQMQEHLKMMSGRRGVMHERVSEGHERRIVIA